MSENIKRFELTSKDLKFKDILKKEFLELEIWAISDIYPNRNKSAFTLSSMEQAMPDFHNKPIVGFFEKEDFTSHEGVARLDTELKQGYWDVSGPRGERILGWIRESDNVEIVEKDGLHWLKFSCALCVHYCYQQVKRLLKDRHKKVSVEVDIVKSHTDEQGIEVIDEFVLKGVTILGRKNGKEVLEGIPDAHLTVLEQLDDEMLNEQRKILSFAYEQLDEKMGCAANEDKNLKKEENTRMEGNILENTLTEEKDANLAAVNEPVSENFEQNISCNSNEEVSNAEADMSAENECNNLAADTQEPAVNEPTTDLNMQNGENSSTQVLSTEGEGQTQESAETVDNNCNQSCEGGEPVANNSCDEKMAAMEAELEAAHAQCEELNAKCCKFEADLVKAQTDLADLTAQFEAVTKRADEAEAKVFAYHCAELRNKATSMLGDDTIAEQDRSLIFEKCDKGLYSSEEEIKRDIAYALYNMRPAMPKTTEERFSAPVEPLIVAAQPSQQKLSLNERIALRAKNIKG